MLDPHDSQLAVDMMATSGPTSPGLQPTPPPPDALVAAVAPPMQPADQRTHSEAGAVPAPDLATSANEGKCQLTSTPVPTESSMDGAPPSSAAAGTGGATANTIEGKEKEAAHEVGYKPAWLADENHDHPARLQVCVDFVHRRTRATISATDASTLRPQDIAIDVQPSGVEWNAVMRSVLSSLFDVAQGTPRLLHASKLAYVGVCVCVCVCVYV